MGAALLGGLIDSGWARGDELAVVEPVDARRKELSDLFAGVGVHDAPVDADGAVIAVKPNDVEAACASIRGRTSLVLSIAAGVPLAKLEGWLAAGTPVVRAMPNTPALVGAGAAAIAAGGAAKDADLAWAEAVLGAVGTVTRVPEKLLDAVT